MNDSLAIFIDRAGFYLRDAAVTISQYICKPDASLKINGRIFVIDRLLGEGGFSFVYLVKDQSSQRQMALKKILITPGSGPETMKEILKEAEAYRRFRSPHIIRLLDSAVVQDEESGGKIVYLFLPYYKRGNLQDAISHHTVTGDRMSEKEMLHIFKGTCLAVRAMHKYRLPSTHVPSSPTLESILESSSSYPPAPRGMTIPSGPVGDAGRPLMDALGEDGDNEVIFDDEVETRRGKGKGKEVAMEGEGEIVPYAHRDIKPANVMIADDGSAILMDFGSVMKARIRVETRQQALLEQDIAAEHSTMPYRAPELFDVKTGQTLDEKVDIWSLGCTLFALAYSYSPFEDPAAGGGSIAMAVGSGRYRHPANSPYSKAFSLLIDSMLIMDPAKRPDIDKVLELTDGVIATLR